MQMKSLVIVGASALGREYFSYVCDACPSMKVRGFLDSRPDVLDGFAGYPPVLGPAEGYRPQDDDVFLVAVGDSAARRAYAERIAAAGGKFHTLVHPTVVVGRNVRIGEGSVVRPMAVIGSDATIGRHVIVGTQSLLAHDCVMDDFTTISPGCHVAGRCHFHECTFMGIHGGAVPDVELGGEGPVFVAAGAVVTHSFASGKLRGVPAKQAGE